MKLYVFAFPADDWDAVQFTSVKEAIDHYHEHAEKKPVVATFEAGEFSDVTLSFRETCAEIFLNDFEGDEFDAPQWLHGTSAFIDWKQEQDDTEQYGTYQQQVAREYYATR